ncbi:hypothetical protein WG66_008588 [Moniliophthora roreri]|nr:hypothetical protein WG66_008588 [Moniliophthora roreri]
MAQASLVSVNLANTALESFLYGIFFVLNAGSIALLVCPRDYSAAFRETRENRFKSVFKKPMFLGAIVLFIGITGHWICTVMRLFAAQSTYKGGKAPLEYYSDISQGVYAIKTGFLEASLIVGDAMLAFSLLCVYHPTFLFSLNVHTPSRARTNLYSSVLIAWPIWFTSRRTKSTGITRVVESGNLTSILSIFIESALLYTSWTVVFIATYAAKSHIEAIIADCWAVMAGISFGLLNVRIGMGWGMDTSSSDSSIIPRFCNEGDSNPAGDEDRDLAYPMQPLAVHVHQVKNIVQSRGVVSFPEDKSNSPQESESQEKH